MQGYLLCSYFLHRIIVLELIIRGNSAAYYVEKPRLGASGEKRRQKISSKLIFSGLILKLPDKIVLN